jgi:predicted dehydrogenase
LLEPISDSPYAAEYNVPPASVYGYDNYDEIVNNKLIDAVYIALPNSMHAEYTIRAAKAGKHVLCEKPMATSVEDSRTMIDACKAANRKLMIAYRCPYEPVNMRAIQLIREGKLGKIQVIESAPTASTFTPASGGSTGNWAAAARYLTGEEPLHVEGYSSVVDRDGRFDEVEENLSWTMMFPSASSRAATRPMATRACATCNEWRISTDRPA